MTTIGPAEPPGVGAAPPPREVRQVLSAYLDAVSLVEPIQARLWRQARLTLVQARLLRRLRREPRWQSDLGRGLGLSPASLTRLIDRLEERGLVTRRRDAEDRRRVVVSLAPPGEQLVGETRMLYGSALQRAVVAMPSERRQRLLESLRELAETAQMFAEEEDVEEFAGTCVR